MPSTRICLVRHGETAWNAEGRVQGQTDIPLSPVGHAQARAAAAILAQHDFSAIYSSDLLRVRQTAAPAAQRLALPVTLDAQLRERHYGIFECLLYTEVRERFPEHYARFRDKDPEFDFDTGESLRAFSERALAALGRIAQAHPGEQVLVFTHGGVLDMVYRHIHVLGLSSARDFGVPNAGLNWVACAGDCWSMQSWADVEHLKGALDDLPG
jgi:2,3-bisphosphoglycerate-dependent phosphoglycerate mutase